MSRNLDNFITDIEVAINSFRKVEETTTATVLEWVLQLALDLKSERELSAPKPNVESEE